VGKKATHGKANARTLTAGEILERQERQDQQASNARLKQSGGKEPDSIEAKVVECEVSFQSLILFSFFRFSSSMLNE
jgi:hypothetical protein